MASELSPRMLAEIEELRRKGGVILGPGPASRTHTAPTSEGAGDPGPGMHCQITARGRTVEGYGATADGAVADALRKL